MGNFVSSPVADYAPERDQSSTGQKNKEHCDDHNQHSMVTEVEPFDTNDKDKLHDLKMNTASTSSASSWNKGGAGGAGGGGGGRGMGKRNPSFFRVTTSSPNPNNNTDGAAAAPSSPLSLKVMNKGLVEGGLTRILVLYCGGTIGMKKDPVKGYLPLKNYLSSFLQSHDRFHDNDHLQTLLRKKSTHYDIHSMDTSLGAILLHFLEGKKRVAYQIHEVREEKQRYHTIA